MSDDHGLRERIETAIWHSTYQAPKPSPEPSSDRYWLNVCTDAVLEAIGQFAYDVTEDAAKRIASRYREDPLLAAKRERLDQINAEDGALIDRIRR